MYVILFVVDVCLRSVGARACFSVLHWNLCMSVWKCVLRECVAHIILYPIELFRNKYCC